MSDRPVFTRLPRYVAWLGIGLGLGMGVEVVAVSTVFPPDTVMIPRLVTSAPFVAGLIYGGYRLSGAGIPTERYPRIGWWTLGGLAGFLLVNVGIMLAVPPVNVLVLFGWIRWAVTLGAFAGFLIGTFEARAIHREVVAARGQVSFERQENRRDLLAYLERLLDRDVTPRVDAIAERAESLIDREAGEDAAAIRQQARALQSILGHADHMLDPNGDVPSLEPTNLAAMLVEEFAEGTPRSGARVDCDVSGDDEWYVLADRLLAEAFGHLVACLVEWDDRDAPRISVRVDPAPETVTVRVASGGATVPEGERGTLFEYAGGDTDADVPELGFVALLVEYYGGSIDLVEDGSDGAAFDITLRRVAVGTDDPSSNAGTQPRVTG